MLPALQRRHTVFAPTLPGHAGGPPWTADPAAAVEAMLDAEGIETAAIAGNSLGGHLALKLAERGRATAVVALAPAGGWQPGDPVYADLIRRQHRREVSTRDILAHPERVPTELLTHIGAGVAACPAADTLLADALAFDWDLQPERITCPVRIVWGLEDQLLPYPDAAARYRAWLPHADWVELDDVGHSPQLDSALETGQIILGATA